ncbi:MAG: hypothetical protein ACJ8DI_02955 [Ktedonobacteraceae bacterium]
MTLLSLADCCHLLSIDPKTLRGWARNASMSLTPHPADARVKCLTKEHVQQLAGLHGRPLAPSTDLAPPPHLDAAQTPTHTYWPELQALANQPEAVLQGTLSHLEIQVATMQQQLTTLALELLQERTLRYEQRLQTLEALIQPPQRQHVQPPAPLTRGEKNQPEESKYNKPSWHPAELRARSRLIPLIEYGAAGTYVVICPQRGELHLTPDSPQWFDWLATLSSFRFVGQQGRLSACRKSRTSRAWCAYRTIHQRNYRHYLGVTDHLTIACLEHGAATLQSHMALL